MATVLSDTITCPASSIQEQFWLLNQMYPESPAYNIPLLYRIKGRLNRACLIKSINKVIRRHEAFRTYFVIEKGRLLQKIEPELAMAFDHESIGNEAEAFSIQEIEHVIRDEVNRPFTLSELPLIRLRLLSLPDGDTYFLIVMHHIITDLRTKDLLTAELSTLYDIYLNQKSKVLLAPAPRYAEFASWQREWLASDECEAMISFWRGQLACQAGHLELPMEKKRPALVTLQGETLSFQFDASFTRKLRIFSRQNNVTVFLTLLTAYVVLLFRYSGQSHLTIGVPLTNRRKDKFKNTMGCFVNILPLALSCSDEITFLELLRNVRFAMLGAHRNQEVPFQLLANTLAINKDPSYNPLFQTGFAFENPSILNLAGLDVTAVPMNSGGSQLDIFLTLFDIEGGIQGYFEYNTDLFEDEMVHRFAENYKTLLSEIVQDGDRSISVLPVLSACERKRECVDWNSTDVSHWQGAVVHQMIEKQVAKTPSYTAAIFDGMQLSYEILNNRANQLAHYIRFRGVKTGDLVGIFMERSLEMLVSLLGVMKAGAAYVPLDPTFPEERILFMVSHSQVSVLVTQESLRGALSESTAFRIFVDSDREMMERESTENPEIDISPESLVYVIYTSGSTGRPKGVKVHHRAVVNFLCSMAVRPGLNSEDVLLAVTTLSFDISVLELFLPLTVGARSVIVTRETASDGAQLLDCLTRNQVTVLQATPVTWRLLLSAGWEGGRHFKILCGGEALPVELASVLVEKASSVWNMYGPTETTVWSTCSQITNGDAPICVGRPIDNTRIYILDKRMQPVPTGVAGTLFIGGVGVTKGYLNQPDLTAEKFVRDPFNEIPHATIYNTGDLARCHADGTIEVMGREDFQVKINGFRIEIGEIEAVLASHPWVTQAIVSVHEFEPGDVRLVAYYTHENGRRGLMSELRHYLAGKLPDYMVPAIFMPVDTVPLTPNGKVDRKNLPVPQNKRPRGWREYLPPQNKLEGMLTEIWRDVLKLDYVGVNEKFFEIGGTSLLGVRVVGLVGAELNREVPVLKLFQYPTIESFAAYLSSGTTDNVLHEKIQDRAKLRRRSFIQRRDSS